MKGIIVTKYEDIYKDLKEAVKEYFFSRTEGQIRYLIEAKRVTNETGLRNELIQLPPENKEISYSFYKDYLSREYIKGEIGTGSKYDQMNNITNISLLMFLSNRIAKDYKKKAEKYEISQEYDDSIKKRDKCYLNKDEAIQKLLASLYILKETEGIEYSYGYYKDDERKDAFIIDLPLIEQICVHFGKRENKQNIIKKATKQICSTLERHYGKKANEINLSAEDVCPQYTGRLFEYFSGLPVENVENIEDDILQLSDIMDIAEAPEYKDIKKIHNQLLPIKDNYGEEIKRTLNIREAYHLAIKLGWSKDNLETLRGVYRRDIEKINEQIYQKYQKKCNNLKPITPEERKKSSKICYEKAIEAFLNEAVQEKDEKKLENLIKEELQIALNVDNVEKKSEAIKEEMEILGEIIDRTDNLEDKQKMEQIKKKLFTQMLDTIPQDRRDKLDVENYEPQDNREGAGTENPEEELIKSVMKGTTAEERERVGRHEGTNIIKMRKYLNSEEQQRR